MASMASPARQKTNMLDPRPCPGFAAGCLAARMQFAQSREPVKTEDGITYII